MSTTAVRAAQTGLCPGHNIIMNMIYYVAISIEPIFWIDDLYEMTDNLLQSTKQRAVLSMGTAIELRQRANREDILSIETLSRAPTAFIDLLTERASAIKLAEPGPSPEQLSAMLKAAVSAADHGRIRPWRFVVIEGEARKRFGNLLAEAHRDANPECTEEQLDQVRAKALRAPTIVALLCKMDKTHKVPVIEQQYAAAAAGAHLMLAAKALGFGSNWKTGAPAYHPIVRNGLGFGDDVAIVGFFYIGTEPKPSPLQRASIDSVVQYWAD